MWPHFTTAAPGTWWHLTSSDCLSGGKCRLRSDLLCADSQRGVYLEVEVVSNPAPRLWKFGGFGLLTKYYQILYEMNGDVYYMFWCKYVNKCMCWSLWMKRYMYIYIIVKNIIWYDMVCQDVQDKLLYMRIIWAWQWWTLSQAAEAACSLADRWIDTVNLSFLVILSYFVMFFGPKMGNWHWQITLTKMNNGLNVCFLQYMCNVS